MTLPEALVLAAVFTQVALTFALLLWLGARRVPLITSRQVRMGDIALSREGWPEKVIQLGNAVDNQFQLPMLFYLAAVLALWSGTAGWVLAALSWAFVLLRIAHAAIHVTDNDVPRRFVAYTAGLFVLMAVWVVLGVLLAVRGAA